MTETETTKMTMTEGDMLNLTLVRRQVYASSGSTSGKQTTKRVTVRKVLGPDTVVVRDKKRPYRLDLNKAGTPMALTNPQRGGAAYTVLACEVV